MKKKIVISEKVTAVMLAAAMAISMTACGSPAKDMQGAAETAADEETSTVETAADGETSAVETVSEIVGNTTESTENAATDVEILVAEDPDTEITASNENTDIKVTVEDQKEEKKTMQERFWSQLAFRKPPSKTAAMMHCRRCWISRAQIPMSWRRKHGEICRPSWKTAIGKQLVLYMPSRTPFP